MSDFYRIDHVFTIGYIGMVCLNNSAKSALTVDMRILSTNGCLLLSLIIPKACTMTNLVDLHLFTSEFLINLCNLCISGISLHQ